MGNRVTTTVSLRAVCEQYDGPVDVSSLFGRLTDGGTVPGSILLESGDFAPTYAERSIGVIRPSVCIRGRGAEFELFSLDRRGQSLLPAVVSRFPGAARITEQSPTLVRGELRADLSSASFLQRLRNPSHMDLLRALLPERVDVAGGATAPIGIYGCFAYDFIRQFEDIPRPKEDVLGDPDYIFYLSTRLFVTDQIHHRTTLISAFPEEEAGAFRDEADQDLAELRAAIDHLDSSGRGSVAVGDFTSDTTESDFCKKVAFLQEAIAEGRVFQVVYGRMFKAAFEGDAFAVYQSLKRCNPSPYMFYLRDDRGTLLGASPELAVRVSNRENDRKVELKPIAGTKPRGLRDGRIDVLLDERFEVALKVDAKELAEHTMLIDLARNDIASISKPGTTRLEEALVTEKYSHVQHLVSKVSGLLKDEHDAFDAYLATMNMGTLTGAPKPEAMKLISELETSARGFFGGGVGFITCGGEMETAIVIRALRVIDQAVYIRAGAGVVADSIPRNEWLETAGKAESCIQALKNAQKGL